MIGDAEHPFIYSLVICISTLEKCLLVPLPIFKSVCFFLFLFLSCMSYSYILDTNPLIDIWFANIFSLLHKLPFHSVDLFCCAKAF